MFSKLFLGSGSLVCDAASTLTLTARSSSTYLYYDDGYRVDLHLSYISTGLSLSHAQPNPLFGFWLGSQFYEAQAVQSQAQVRALGQARARTSLT